MKKINYLLVLFTICFTTINAQENTNDQPIIIGDQPAERMSTLSQGINSHGVYFGLSTGYSQINNKDILSLGVKFAYVADTKFEIGLAFEGIQSEKGIATFEDQPLYLSAGMGGLHLEPILFGRKSIHISFPIFLGGGAAYTYERAIFDDHDFPLPDPTIPTPINPDRYEEWDLLLMAQPGVNVVFNVTRFLQVEVGGKYRFTTSLDLPGTNLENLNAPVGHIGLKLGYFDFGKRRRL